MINLYKLTTWSTKVFQRALNDYGAKPKLKVDGILGPKTTRAFVDFQFRNNIAWTDDITDSLESLGLEAIVKPSHVALRKAKRNVSVEKPRDEEPIIVEPDEEDIEEVVKTKGKTSIEIPTKKSKCFKRKKWIDGAKKGPNVVVKGTYPVNDGMPIGAVFHHTAGWNKPGSAVSTLKRTKYGFMAIDSKQGLYQPANMPLNKWGNHAGTSKAFLVGYGNTSRCSNKLVGFEINAGGLLSKGKKSKGQDPNEYYTWFNKKVPKSKRRYVAKSTPFGGPRGWYEKFSLSQEYYAEDVAVWLCLNDPKCKWQNMLGHHEIAGMRFLDRWRKNDPGGSMSVDMEAFRQRVRKRVEKILSR